MAKFGKVKSKKWYDKEYKNHSHRNVKEMVEKYISDGFYRDDEKLKKLDSVEFRGLIFNLNTCSFGAIGYSIKGFITYFMTGEVNGWETDIANYLPYDLKDFTNELKRQENN